MKKLITYICVLTLMMSSIVVSAEADPGILKEQVQNVYVARSGAKAIIENLRFSDVKANNWAIEPIMRFGALEVIKGYNEKAGKEYRPKVNITNEETLAVLLRVLGMEAAAQQAGNQLLANNPDLPDHVLTLWTKGYLQLATNMGLITQDNLDDALLEEQNELLPEENFIRRGPITREQLAVWIVKVINSKDPNMIAPLYEQQEVFNYSDWEKIDRENIPYVEAVIEKKILVGNNGKFGPKGHVTREQMAQVLKNIDNMIYDTLNVRIESGMVSYIEDSNVMGATNSTAKRRILIRDENGKVNEVNFEYERNANDQIFTKDVPVLIDGKIGGLLSIREGEYMEYLIDKTTNEMVYAYSKGIDKPYVVEGALQPLTDIENGQITVKNASGVAFTYTIKDSLYNKTTKKILINDMDVESDYAPISKQIELYIENNIVTKITTVKGAPLFSEISGIVKENEPMFGYITIMTWDGRELTKHYKSSISVEKQQYYDTEDEIGYIDEMFPDFRFDPRDSTIEDIEAGDMVFIRLASNQDKIMSISAKTNYVVKYGTIKYLVHNGTEGIRINVEFDDLSTSVFDVPANIPVKKAGKNMVQSDLQEGQVIKMLINQAIFEPGTMTEMVKEIQIDEYGNTVTNIYKGKLGNINKAARSLTLLNTYTLTKAGWRDYEKAKVLDISNKYITYFLDGKQISLEYALNYLKVLDIHVYVAMEKYYDGEKIIKINFGTGRDQVLNQDNITYSNGINTFRMLGSTNNIRTNPGTIVIKNGKLLESNNIVSPDYVQVVLNGANTAAVVNVTPEPSIAATSIFRGRIQSINENTSMSVQSFALLLGMNWIYSPIPRVFTTDYDTVIVDSNGIVSHEDFIDYTQKTKVNKVYTIISDGTKAKYIVENPYCKEGVKGEIYETGTGYINIKDTIVYNTTNNLWSDLSYTNSYAKINLKQNSIIIKNNEVITPDQLEQGDVIRVLTTENLITKLAVFTTRDVDGYIILVER